MDKYTYGDRHYLTSNFYCAIFLYVKGLQLVDIDKTNPRKALFVFLDSPERENWIRQYNFAEKGSQDVMVDARQLEIATKTLKDRLYQERGEQTVLTG